MHHIWVIDSVLIGEYKAKVGNVAQLRREIEWSLAGRIPRALTPAAQEVRPAVATGMDALDELLGGGFPLGAISEVVGAECSGRTTLAMSFLARITQAGQVAAWVDVSGSFDAESAAASGVDLGRVLWVGCGGKRRVAALPVGGVAAMARRPQWPVQVGGGGGHPRGEARGVDRAVKDLLGRVRYDKQFSAGSRGGEGFEPRCAEMVRAEPPVKKVYEAVNAAEKSAGRVRGAGKPWGRLERAIRVTDLLLQAGGFGVVVLDLAGVAAEFAARVPLGTWFRFRAAAERTRTCLLLLAQQDCAKSSAGAVLRLGEPREVEGAAQVFNGLRGAAEVAKRRFAPTVAMARGRKPPQGERGAMWQSRAHWTGHE